MVSLNFPIVLRSVWHLIDGVDLATGLACHPRVSQDKFTFKKHNNHTDRELCSILTDRRVEHEAIDAMASGEDDHGGASIQGVTSCHDLTALNMASLETKPKVFFLARLCV